MTKRLTGPARNMNSCDVEHVVSDRVSGTPGTTRQHRSRPTVRVVSKKHRLSQEAYPSHARFPRTVRTLHHMFDHNPCNLVGFGRHVIDFAYSENKSKQVCKFYDAGFGQRGPAWFVRPHGASRVFEFRGTPLLHTITKSASPKLQTMSSKIRDVDSWGLVCGTRIRAA